MIQRKLCFGEGKESDSKQTSFWKKGYPRDHLHSDGILMVLVHNGLGVERLVGSCTLIVKCQEKEWKK